MSVDDFWRQLNVKKSPSVRLPGLTDIPGLTRHSRTVPAQNGQLTEGPAPAPKPSVAATQPGQQELQVCRASHIAFGVAGLFSACLPLQASIQRDINCLLDPDRSLRRKAVGLALLYMQACLAHS